ncbi:hypothetical protein IWX49DRAFT_125170 [Phyllosticta citricarpa]
MRAVPSPQRRAAARTTTTSAPQSRLCPPLHQHYNCAGRCPGRPSGSWHFNDFTCAICSPTIKNTQFTAKSPISLHAEIALAIAGPRVQRRLCLYPKLSEVRIPPDDAKRPETALYQERHAPVAYLCMFCRLLKPRVAYLVRSNCFGFPISTAYREYRLQNPPLPHVLLHILFVAMPQVQFLIIAFLRAKYAFLVPSS